MKKRKNKGLSQREALRRAKQSKNANGVTLLDGGISEDGKPIVIEARPTGKGSYVLDEVDQHD